MSAQPGTGEAIGLSNEIALENPGAIGSGNRQEIK
jgi:hypothetical protein